MLICVHLVRTFQLAQSEDEHVPQMTLSVVVRLAVQAEPIEDARQQTDIVANLRTVPKHNQCREVLQP